MANNYNITRESFTQSQIFKNILSVGTKMASFLHQAKFVSDQETEAAADIVKNWRNIYEGFADYEEKEWEAIRHAEIIEDIVEYLAKAKALADMALQSNLNDISAETLHGYFWELSSLINITEMVFNDLR